MPLRKIDFISSVLALAEPVPFTVAILMVNSLMRVVFAGDIVVSRQSWVCAPRASGPRPRPAASAVPTSACPRPRSAALRAQAAVHAQIFVLHHDAAGLRQAR